MPRLRGVTPTGPARRATLLVFLSCGIASSVWAVIVPFMKQRLGLDDAGLGFILLGFGAGAIATMPFNAALIGRFGSRRMTLVAGLLIAGGLWGIALAPLPLLAGLAVLLLGAAFGVLDVAMNAQAVVLEARAARPMMSTFHALFSVGGLVGSGCASGLLRLGVPVLACVALGSAVIAALVLDQHRWLLTREADFRSGGRGFSLPRGRAALLGAMCLVCFLTEGAVLDWGAVLLRFTHGVTASWAGLGYAGFSVTMAAGRLCGDALTRRVGGRAVLLAGSLVTAAGVAVAVSVPSAAVSVFGFVLIGAGAANIVPVLLSAAGRLPGQPPAQAIAAVASMGYAGLLAGPAAIGAAAQATSLPVALGGVAVLMLGVAACARMVDGRG